MKVWADMRAPHRFPVWGEGSVWLKLGGPAAGPGCWCFGIGAEHTSRWVETKECWNFEVQVWKTTDPEDSRSARKRGSKGQS